MQEENVLIQAGLSGEQAVIYQALLEKGPQRASDLGKWTGIKRGLVYKVLEQLVAMNLVANKGGPGTVAVFSPAHPSLLLANIERKEKEIALTKDMLEGSLGALVSKYNLLAGKPNIRFFEGAEGVASVVRDSLTSKTEILTYADNEAMNKYYPALNQENISLRKKSQIKKRIISVDSPYIRELAKNDDPEITERRVLRNVHNFATAMQIYDNKVAYVTLEPERSIGFIIEDRAVYAMQKDLFETMWQMAEPLSP